MSSCHREFEFYDFSIVTHTIGQAIAHRDKAEKERKQRLEKERIALEKQAEEDKRGKEREELEDYSEGLSKEEREELRQRALEELGNTKDLKKEFVSDILIAVKENELLKSQM